MLVAITVTQKKDETFNSWFMSSKKKDFKDGCVKFIAVINYESVY